MEIRKKKNDLISNKHLNTETKGLLLKMYTNMTVQNKEITCSKQIQQKNMNMWSAIFAHRGLLGQV